MSKLEQYKIDLIGSNTESIYEYSLDEQFFTKIENSEINQGNIKATVQVIEKNQSFELKISLIGSIHIPCNLCLDDMEQAIEIEENMLVKLGNEYNDEDEIIVVDELEGKMNIAWFLYEYIVVNIPLKHKHPKGECNETMLSKLKKHITTLTDDEEISSENNNNDSEFATENKKIDPRWEALQHLLDNN